MPRKVGDGVKKCLEACDRIEQLNCLNIRNPDSTAIITPSLVGKEAGFGAGYVKPKRNHHQEIIKRIENLNNKRTKDLVTNSVPPEISENNPLEKERKRVKEWKEKYNLTKQRLDASLSRELVLLETIRNLEKELENSQSEVKHNHKSATRGEVH